MFRKVLLSFWAGQTRRRLGGRQPLCGTGVTSEIAPTSRPTAPSERIAVSRPEPGPFTNTSTRFMPCSIARRPAASAAIWAAYGVDLREPLKPTVPADAQAITLPLGSVIEMTVLLKVLLMWAWPATTFFFSLRRTFFAAAPRPAVAIIWPSSFRRRVSARPCGSERWYGCAGRVQASHCGDDVLDRNRSRPCAGCRMRPRDEDHLRSDSWPQSSRVARLDVRRSVGELEDRH